VERDDCDRALNEEIDTLLRQAEPSPQFRARVLQHIDAEPEPVWRLPWFALIPAAAAMALLVMGALVWLRVPADDGPVASTRPASAPIATAPRPPAIPSQSTSAPEQPPSPRDAFSLPSASEVLISPDDAAAFDAFISSVESGRLWADMFEASDDSLPAAIEPLRLEPLATIPPLKEAEL
jgi:hypothetical protein